MGGVRLLSFLGIVLRLAASLAEAKAAIATLASRDTPASAFTADPASNSEAESMAEQPTAKRVDASAAGDAQPATTRSYRSEWQPQMELDYLERRRLRHKQDLTSLLDRMDA